MAIETATATPKKTRASRKPAAAATVEVATPTPHFQVLHENLARALAIVHPAVASRGVLPITANVKIETDRGRVLVTGTNLDTVIETWIGAKIVREGAITVPETVLSRAVKAIKPNQVLTLEAKSTKDLAMTGGIVSVDIRGMDAVDFPRTRFEPSPGDYTVTIGARELADALTYTSVCAAPEDSRPVLAGVNVEIGVVNDTLGDGRDVIRVTGADGFRLATTTITNGAWSRGQNAELSKQVILPIDGVIALLGTIKRCKPTEPITLRINPTQTRATFELIDTNVIVQTVQGTFPNYSGLIPKVFNRIVAFKANDLAECVATAANIARDGSGIIRWEAGAVENIISAKGEEIGAVRCKLAATTSVPKHKGGGYTTDGETLTKIGLPVTGDRIAFNERYLTQLCKSHAGAELTLGIVAQSSQGTFRATDGPERITVIMPMFVQW